MGYHKNSWNSLADQITGIRGITGSARLACFAKVSRNLITLAKETPRAFRYFYNAQLSYSVRSVANRTPALVVRSTGKHDEEYLQ